MSERNLDEKFPNSFLREVACELRFPPLLVIENKIPEFQEKIRDTLPTYTLSTGIPISSGTPSYPSMFNEWIFSSGDVALELKIMINRFALACKAHEGFESFLKAFMQFFKPFYKLYKVDSYDRVGLRYVNIIPLEPKEDPIEEILRLFNPIPDTKLIEKRRPFSYELDFRWNEDPYKITVKNGLKKSKDGKTHFYLLDIDAYKPTKTEHSKGNLETIIRELHDLVLQEFHNGLKDPFREILRAKKTTEEK